MNHLHKVKQIKRLSVNNINEINELLDTGEWIIYKPILNSDFEEGYELHKVK